jgi:hypothetical protein
MAASRRLLSGIASIGQRNDKQDVFRIAKDVKIRRGLNGAMEVSILCLDCQGVEYIYTTWREKL